jgi:hypothetical protein
VVLVNRAQGGEREAPGPFEPGGVRLFDGRERLVHQRPEALAVGRTRHHWVALVDDVGLALEDQHVIAQLDAPRHVSGHHLVCAPATP